MKLKKTISIVLIAALTIFTFSAAASAGSPQSHRWEGVAIGIGAVILGKALIDSIHNNQARAYGPAPQPAYYQPEPEPPAGHWETRRQWVPAEYKKVWNPGHYNRHNRWVQGRWIRVEAQPGYWVEKEVWIPHY